MKSRTSRSSRRKLDPVTQPLMTRDQVQQYMNKGLSHVVKVENGRLSKQVRSGSHQSAYRGGGFDYDDSREYQAGDELRNLNWRLLARTAQLYTKVFLEEREASVTIVVDRRAGMRFGTRKHLKVTRAVQLACYLAGRYLRQSCSVGITLLEKEGMQFQAQRSQTRVRDGLLAAAAACPPVTEPEESLTLSLLLSQLQHSCNAGNRIVLISDFHDLDENDSVLLTQLSRQHPMQALQVLDPIELALPAAGIWQIEDYGHTSAIKINANDGQLKQQYAEAMKLNLQRLDAIFSDCRVPRQRVFTDQNFDVVLRQCGYA